jgi:phage terminase large subunit-like protein
MDDDTIIRQRIAGRSVCAIGLADLHCESNACRQLGVVGEAVVKYPDDFDADVVVEINFGGDMTTEVVTQAAERPLAQIDRRLARAAVPRRPARRPRCISECPGYLRKKA